MKKLMVFGMALVLLFHCLGCTGGSEPSELHYDIQPVADSDRADCRITYPELHSTSEDFTAVNSAIKSEAYAQAESYLENGTSDVELEAAFTVTYADNEIICILFEGTLAETEAAHPINIAFSVCVSLAEGEAVDPAAYLQLDDDFIDVLREQLQNNQNEDRFDDAQWTQVAEYISNFSDAEMKTILLTDTSKTLAIHNDGVIVIFPVPHAIGDYIKIIIPWEWG